MSQRVSVRPALLRWACERSGKDIADFAARFRKLDAWVRADEAPTLRQLEQFAAATRTPVGYLFLDEPPVERIPIPDFRTVAGRPVRRPSPDLLETIFICEQRQEWYREHARAHGEVRHPFVGSARVGADVVATAATMRATLGRADQPTEPTWEAALRALIGQADAAGVLVMCSGVVLNNNKRTLDPDEFRGFALVDELAPLVFVNGADSKSAQMFTVAHELAHIWAGESALSDVDALARDTNSVERWCNQVAAEFLVPLAAFRAVYKPRAAVEVELRRLARLFKVSTLVVLRRMLDAGGLTRAHFGEAYEREVERLAALERKSGGGDFYLTTAARVSKRFARALVASTLGGETLYRDAFRLLGVAKIETFRRLGESLEAR
ncbi:MAG: ImmA/IrrE family metallo-endopeptidase [Myxococcales bacterium]|nr:ImmA/IrrE family metallo-endopeptidase [Myxococcales bacterium]